MYNTDSARSNAQEITITQGSQIRYLETDFLGRTTLVAEPETQATTYSYNYSTTPGLGLTVTRVRPQANQGGTATTTTTTQYDSLGRVVSVNYMNGTTPDVTPNRSFFYDFNNYWLTVTANNLQGRLGSTRVGGGASVNGSELSYDAMGRVVNLWQCGPSTCGTANQTSRGQSYAYDWAGNLIQESDGVSGTISYGRSIAGEVTSITNETYQDLPYNPPNLVSNVVNGPNGPMSYALGNGLNVFQSYDQLGRLAGRWVCNGTAAMYCSGGTQVYGTSSVWSGSRMNFQSDTVLNQQLTYGYDEFNRLISRTVSSGTVQNYGYGYDQYGNRISQVGYQGGWSFNPTINPATNQITTSGYSYDAAGNLVNDGAHSYQYDAEGNVLQVDGGTTASYVYDAFNRRIAEQTPSGTHEFTYDYAGRRISGWLPSSNYGDQGRIYWDNQQIAFRAGDGTNFDHQDTLGMERMRTLYDGSVGASYQSLPWGDGYTATVNNSYAGLDSLDFAGLERDVQSTTNPEEDTEHAQFRNYAPAQGQVAVPGSIPWQL